MIDPKQLLLDLQKQLKRLEPDILGRCESNLDIDAPLRSEYVKAKSAGRTAQAYEIWLDDYITQVAVAWILGCVFVRFLEDNRLTDTALLSGPGERLQFARDQHTIYFEANPTHSDREYLEHVFLAVAEFPSMRELLDGEHNPITRLGPTGDAARELLEFWQKIEPSTGKLIHDFTDPEWNTRFLGDLYQDLSKSARERYALLQTPEFVEEFILDRTLNLAIEEFGYATVKVIDPACGSGHFLLGSFRRLLNVRLRNEPGVPIRVHVQAVLNHVCGVDVNAFAVAIARFRLLIAALGACGVTKITEAPEFNIKIVTGDALLHGSSPRGLVGVQRTLHADPLQHYYEIEDAELLQQVISDKYHAVVGNPPYINVSDKALRDAYRSRFGTCSGKYQLSVPFLERFFDLSLGGERPGFIGTITSIAFTKQSFGRKLVEEYLPKWELTHVIDTSRAHIPSHGTPTVILFARNREPVTPTLRMVRGIRGEKRKPEDPRQGAVWLSIVNQVDLPGSESEWASVADVSRENLKQHPWPIGGGGAAELVEKLSSDAYDKLAARVSSIGITCFTLLDDVYCIPSGVARRHRIREEQLREFVSGENLRDWAIVPSDEVVVFPYSAALQAIECDYSNPTFRYLWRARTSLANGIMFGGKTKLQAGLQWYEFGRLTTKKLRIPLSIAFCNITTHNHFALDRGQTILNSHALVIKLPPESTAQEHLQFVGLLNSSIAWLWMKQMCHSKGGGGVGGGIATEAWEQFAELTASPLMKFPLPSAYPAELANAIQNLVEERMRILPDRLVAHDIPTRERLNTARQRAQDLFHRMIALQEELDWQVYSLYGLTDDSLTLRIEQVPPIALGQRAFEIIMARKMASGELETSWFDRHRSVPLTEIPGDLPEEYQRLIERRIAAIESDRDTALVEQPEYKRRWNLAGCGKSNSVGQIRLLEIFS